MRVLYVVTKWNQPTETFVRREVAEALSAGSDVGVVSLRRPGRPDGIVDEELIDIHWAGGISLLRGLGRAVRRRPRALLVGIWTIIRLGRPRTWPSHLAAWLSAAAVWDDVDAPDLVMAHFAWVSATTADQLARMWDAPYAVFAHAHDIYERRCVDRYLRDRLQRAVAVFVESERIAADVQRMYQVVPIVMRMGVPDEFVLQRPRPTLSTSAPLVLSVGALRTKKGHDDLVRAISEIDDVQLRIVGAGPERSNLEALIAQLRMAGRVELLGVRTPTEVRQLLDEADVFCLASRQTATGDRDGVPNVLIEAMSRGVPVVSTPVAGIPDLLADGCGYVAEAPTADAVRAAIRNLLENPEESAARAAKALNKIRSQYTTARNWGLLDSHLREAVRVYRGVS